ncbi:MAG: hypothetical protein DSY80_10835 [Desulfocapsa sp.]|nr:MAG: hypothetical protein DSY80_10835 [Desulfocapsa sp.]
MKGLVLCLLFLFAIVPDMQAENLQIESVQASFVQQKNMAILARPLLSHGRFLFQAPDSLRWEYYTPLHSVLLMDKGRIRKFIEQDGKFIEEHGMGLSAMQVVMQEISGWLAGNISDTATFLAQQTDAKHVLLTPRGPALAKIISRIELTLLNERSGLLESVTLYEGKNSSTRMDFSDAKINESIPVTLFQQP